jgi:hypothetical protein
MIEELPERVGGASTSRLLPVNPVQGVREEEEERHQHPHHTWYRAPAWHIRQSAEKSGEGLINQSCPGCERGRGGEPPPTTPHLVQGSRLAHQEVR